jgi:DNA-binding MarR family transcriptional regulator
MSESPEQSEPITMYEACLLHSRADRTLRLIVAKQLEQYNITMMEWLLLGSVQNGPKEGVTMSSVAATLDVTLPQVTALTTGLTKNKLVKQKISRQDRRSRRLTMTPAGKKLLSAVEEEARKVLRNWVADIPRDQLMTYLKTEEILANRKPENN